MLSRKTHNAIARYGRETCIRAYEDHKAGNGASTIGFCLSLTTRQADAAIDAGREIEEASRPNMNPLHAYAWAGMMAAQARNRNDEALALFHGNWMRKAIALETPEYRIEARKAYDEAYTETRSAIFGKPL